MIRIATGQDMPELLRIFAKARDYMRETGNATQWGSTYPSQAVLEEDIAVNQLYVYEEEGQIHGAFVFFIGDDPTYTIIDDGAWLNDEPYGVIHRVASDGSIKGFFNRCVEFARSHTHNLRIDTHANNHTMQHVIEKNGFVRCGIIYAYDGSPRIAYQMPKALV